MKNSVRTKHDIQKTLQENQTRLRLFGVKKIGLFGSYVRGEQKSDSDIDFLVEFETGRKTFDVFLELSFFLEDILQNKVELVTMEALSPYIGPYILQEVEYVPLAA